MELSVILCFVIIVLLVIHLILFLIMSSRNNVKPALDAALSTALGTALGEALQTQFRGNRAELGENLKSTRDELSGQLKINRDEQNLALKSFQDTFVNQMQLVTTVLERNRVTMEKKLGDIQADTNVKLEKMRETVDEKLHQTLEKRLGDSFKLVSERLELVQRGLGEMQNLAAGVGDLKKVLSNVKTKGVLGEYQLDALLEQLMTPAQYDKNVKTKAGSRDNVEFAIKIPSKDEAGGTVYLPIDSKFPTSDYETLMNAYEAGDVEVIARAQKELEMKIKKFARDIHEKYVDPPNTTEFAIMFLPFEGLYAEVLRIPGLFESIQNGLKVTITGPTTISAFLNSLQMGFRSLAVEKRTSEIWSVLGAVRTEFGKFGEVLESAKKKLDAASEELSKTGVRTRQIEKRLADVQTLPDAAAQKLLEL